MLNNNKQQQQQAQLDQNTTTAQSHIDLERVFASFSANNPVNMPKQTQYTPQQLSQAPTLSHALQQQQQQQQQISSAANPNLQAILAALSVPGQQHAPQNPQQPVVAALQQSNYPGVGLAAGTAGPAQTPNLGALLASLGQVNGAASGNPANVGPDQHTMYEDPERKRVREAGDMEERDGDFNKRRKWGGKPRQQVRIVFLFFTIGFAPWT